MTQKPSRGDFREFKSKKNSWGNMPPHWTPLETCAFGTHLGNWPVFILDPHLKVLTCQQLSKFMYTISINSISN